MRKRSIDLDVSKYRPRGRKQKQIDLHFESKLSSLTRCLTRNCCLIILDIVIHIMCYFRFWVNETTFQDGNKKQI